MCDVQRLPTTISPQLESYTVGGVHVSCVDRAQAVDTFFQLVSEKVGGFITVRDAHGIVEAQTDNRLREIINSARMTLPDGMPIVWVGKLKNAAVQRVPGTEFFDSVMRDPRARRIRHYFYGGQTKNTFRVVARATDLLGIDAISGWHSPPFRPVGTIEDTSILAQIAATQPDVIWIGLSTPKQEYWMANHAAHFPRTIFVGVGAVFDFFAGTRTRAPVIVQRIGFEWLFRLIQEPKRLWPRYRRVVPGMLRILIAEAMRR
jgi:N-acetylglucosaminyldiphosphoundecaprenol N-acetyl-beta-D-mannosaminyltransferase